MWLSSEESAKERGLDCELYVMFSGSGESDQRKVDYCLGVLFLSPATRKERKETYFKWERKEFVMFVCSFLARVGKKRTKETPLKGEGCFKIRREGLRTKIQQLCRIFCNPLPLKNPITPALLRSAFGEALLGTFAVEIGDADSNGSARGRGRKGCRVCREVQLSFVRLVQWLSHQIPCGYLIF